MYYTFFSFLMGTLQNTISQNSYLYIFLMTQITNIKADNKKFIIYQL